ncbi:PROTEIN WHAT'S THIS FACTOR 1-like protein CHLOROPLASTIC [Salix koriyanagi]|uniref:PROTEIN WHAT'S THIS FACTOR 1-like protein CHLOROPLASTIC n=1 Tax=Salix koriyanagi TaxID=2511006 RepID=A0A9Q1AM89_9ROSI|nr:PROTEIN WHAT'S THIS FACTOR 1-like protein CHLOROPLASTIC [Salix koriyanagi]
MDLQKKPSLILQLKSILQSQKHQSLLLRDLEKEVGFVQKWNFMSVIEKYPSIFRVGGGSNARTPPFVTFTAKAEKIAREEAEARELMEPILVKNLRKLLMMSVDFTSREERLRVEGVPAINPSKRNARISKDGNFFGPFAFKMCFAAGFRPNMSFLEELEKWQRMEFPSPYLNARRFEIADPKARKRVAAVLHELLTLTLEKRMTSAQLDAFHSEYMLPSRLLLCLIKHHGIFYITNKGARSTVFLKDCYDGSNLIEKMPFTFVS